MINTIRKAKNSYLYDIKQSKYFDFRFNSNIIGYSNKKLTTTVKNSISSSWDIKLDSTYHRRFKTFIRKRFGDRFVLRCANSLVEFFLLLINHYKGYLFNIFDDQFDSYIKNYNISLDRENLDSENGKNSLKGISIYDIAHYYLHDKDIKNSIDNDATKFKDKNIKIFNYYHYPKSEMGRDLADIVILPEIYSGNFNYVNILVDKDLEGYQLFTNPIESLPSLYLQSSIKNIFVIEKLLKSNRFTFPELNEEIFIHKERLFTFRDSSDIDAKSQKLVNKNIILNTKVPYYNYFPITLLDYQIKQLRRIFNG